MTTAPSAASTNPPGIEFAIGGLAAVGAGVFTNPIDVIKVRLQLQGELEARNSYKKIYKNTVHAGYLIAKHEGILALQAGIVPALLFQVVLNGIRLGVYNTAKKYELITNKKGGTDVLSTAIVTGIAGCIGASLGSPFYMVKTQLQAQSVHTIAVGYQHNHGGTWSTFRSLWKEGGIAALYRGWHAGIPRIFVGSATQLTTFGVATDWLRSLEIFTDQSISLTFVASLIGGSCVALTMQPFDVLATRLYNQRKCHWFINNGFTIQFHSACTENIGTDASGKGALYNGLLDASVKIFRTEGLTGLYKGIFPTWMRIAPHTVLCLVFYEKIDLFYNRLRN
ncbi:PREDICTED: solute carrier family 25 member 35-like isoform X1 [Dufourea novaeangliae]|uniref:solute carrier family 25 member 35-like isoform X1 n=1 Tax=Dufourea novaeangliae TaxID=178035 RepID=UPI000767C48C|nr:PREDICTED: solute carrier family 25 member 35-like isoform X1 [Dufourea novaeangliae]